MNISVEIKKLIDYWRKLSDYDIKTAQYMLQTKRYPYCLFMYHLAIEKILKAIIVSETNKHAPYSHNLVELAKHSKMAKKTSIKINKIVKDYINVIKEDLPVSKVVLFGSHAKGTAKQGSDIDIAIISNKFGKNPRKEGQYLFRKLWEVKNSFIDPVGYSLKDFNSTSPSPLLHEIRKYGKEIKI